MDGPTKIREWRNARKITQVQLASLIGITQAYLSAIERGRRPAIEVVGAIHDVTHGFVTFDDWRRTRRSAAVDKQGSQP